MEQSNQLRPFLQKQATNMQKPISVEKQITVALYYLADKGRLRKVANAFGISRSSTSIIVRKVYKVISMYLGPKCVQLPFTEQEIELATSNFYKFHRFPQCIGAINGTHIFIKRQTDNPTDFLNRKNLFFAYSCSLQLQILFY